MEKRLSLIVIILCFLGRGCAFGASAPTQAINDDIKNIKPISALTSPATIKTTATPSVAKPNTTITATPPVQPQPVDFGVCSKFFKLDKQKLFYLTLAGVNANRFEIKEIQSKSGYVLFTVGQRPFLASVINVDSKTSMLKITPCNNVYFFPVGIVQNMFKYIELNAATPVEKLGVL